MYNSRQDRASTARREGSDEGHERELSRDAFQNGFKTALKTGIYSVESFTTRGEMREFTGFLGIPERETWGPPRAVSRGERRDKARG